MLLYFDVNVQGNADQVISSLQNGHFLAIMASKKKSGNDAPAAEPSTSLAPPLPSVQSQGQKGPARVASPSKKPARSALRLDRVSYKMKTFYVLPTAYANHFTGQMYVECYTPAKTTQKHPIVLIHGDFHTGQVSSLSFFNCCAASSFIPPRQSRERLTMGTCL